MPLNLIAGNDECLLIGLTLTRPPIDQSQQRAQANLTLLRAICKVLRAFLLFLLFLLRLYRKLGNLYRSIFG